MTPSLALRNVVDGFSRIDFRLTKSEIRNPDGSVVFSLDGIEVPAAFSQVAADVLAQKYFRKAGVPKRPGERTGPKTSAKQVFDRLAGTWTNWGWKGGYFTFEEDAHAFHDELGNMLARQMVAPNSPQWFNTGLHWAYQLSHRRTQALNLHLRAPQPHAWIGRVRKRKAPATPAGAFDSGTAARSQVSGAP